MTLVREFYSRITCTAGELSHAQPVSCRVVVYIGSEVPHFIFVVSIDVPEHQVRLSIFRRRSIFLENFEESNAHYDSVCSILWIAGSLGKESLLVFMTTEEQRCIYSLIIILVVFRVSLDYLPRVLFQFDF